MQRSTGRTETLRRRGSTCLLLTGAAILALAASGPAEVPPLIDEVNVEVVNVDVVVTDANGVPVAGLGPDDFEIREDGVEKAVTNFFSFTEGRLNLKPQPGEAVEQAHFQENRQLRRRMAVLFDMNSIEKRELAAATKSVERFISEQFDGSYEWAVVAYDNKLRLLEPFTSDKMTVLSAIERVRRLPVPLKRSRATDAAFSEHPVIVSRTQAMASAQAIDRSGPTRLSAEDFEVRERMIRALREFDQTVRAAVETMRAYAALPGRKSLVLVTGAMETLPSGPQLLGYGLPGLGGGERTDALIQSLNADLQRRYKAIIQTANAAGFAIYPVSGRAVDPSASTLDVGRERSVSFLQAGTSRNVVKMDTDSTQQILAAGTGGVFYADSKYYGAFDDIDNRTANAYVLGFQTDHDPDQEYHKIEVRVKHPGFRLRNREGYLHLSRRDRLVEELATPLLFPKDRGDFTVAVQVLPPEEERKKSVDLTVAGVIPIEDVTLVPQGEVMVGRVFLFLAVYDVKGELARLVRTHQDLRLPAERVAEFPPGAPARFAIKVEDLERGEYTLTLTLMDEVSDRYGTGLQPVAL